MQSGKNLQKILEPPKSLRSADFNTVFTQPFTVQIQALEHKMRIFNPVLKTETAMDVIYKPDWTNRSFTDAKIQILKQPKIQQATTLMVLPYLSEEHLQDLLQTQLNGLDLCGNAIINTSKTFYWLSGKPNKFKIKQNLKNPYSGKSALVGHMLLEQPVFKKLEDLANAINLRGTQLSIATISRVLSEMRAEIIVDSWQNNNIYLLQPEKLLDQLRNAWKHTEKQSRTLWRGKILQPTETFLPQIFHNANIAKLPTAMTGLGSIRQYSNMSFENTSYIYADAIEPLLQNLEFQTTEHFPNLEIRQPANETVYFNNHTDQNGIRWASLLQTYLEMSNNDTRVQQSATALQTRLIEDTLKKRTVVATQ